MNTHAHYPKGQPRVSFSKEGGAGYITDEQDNSVVGNMETAFDSKFLNLRKGQALVRGKRRQDLDVRGNGRPRRMCLTVA